MNLGMYINKYKLRYRVKNDNVATETLKAKIKLEGDTD